ncbi:hypothetical protein L3Q82_011018 [Scortum barcoo]|uniref:Uncharacterized protein n=1 Tax=Scortum barcoo TaxID=214431 RepID=A0ACB8W8X4_9TELE|nr:hypothetical protein L3Q82_011018 [Scortum barcoo]
MSTKCVLLLRGAAESEGAPPILLPLSILNNMVSAVETFRFLGSIISQDLKVGIQHRHHQEEGPAEDVLPAPTQEVQPASGTADSVCPLHIHHCVVWISHQTGQEQTTTDSQDCRKKSSVPACLPSIQDLVLRPESGNGQVTSLQIHHTLDITCFTSSPPGRRYRALYAKTTRHRNSFFPQADEHLTPVTEHQEQSRKHLHLLHPLGPGPGRGGSSLSRDAQTSLTPDTSSSSSGGPRGVPRPAERHSLSSVSWVFPEGLLPVGHAWNTSLGRRPGGIQNRCPSHLS